MSDTQEAFVENRTFAEIDIGDSASLKCVLNDQESSLFAAISHGGDLGMWIASLISGLINERLPGPGVIFLEQRLRYPKPIHIGDELLLSARVQEKANDRKLTLAVEGVDQHGEIVAKGEVVVLAPVQKIRRPAAALSHAYVYERGDRLSALIERARKSPPVKTAVAHPVDSLSLEGVAGATKAGLIAPILIGPTARIRAAAEEVGINLDTIEIVDTPHSHASAARAVELIRSGAAAMLMKGALHTDELMAEVVDKATGLRTDRRISHIYVLDVPSYDKLIFLSDAAVNIRPTLEEKRDIVQNAIDLARSLGVVSPKTAILSAVETIYPPLQSTLDAAALCKMAERGQIVGGELDGPLAFDNAISPQAALSKRLNSTVAGQADILIVPDLEAGNMLAKQLDYLAGAVAAGVVLGASAPIILTSRAEGRLPRIAASAVAKLHLNNRNAVAQ